MTMAAIQERDVLAALSRVMDPDLNVDIVRAGFVKALEIRGGDVSFKVELTTPACPVKDKLRDEATRAVQGLAGVTSVKVEMTAQVRAGPLGAAKERLLPGVKNVVLVGAGKGGVGKSTVALNLACALQRHGAKVGILDADFYGPSLPTMTGLDANPVSHDGKHLEPLEGHGLKVMSIGFLIEPDQALIWRGPMLQGALLQLVRDVSWGELDYLIIDLPPGTGDVPLTVAQQVRASGAVLVTTPQDVALADVVRARQMFEKLSIPVLGIVENMSQFICPQCGHSTEIFAHGGGRRAAELMGIPFLGEVPLDLRIRLGSDKGLPLVVEAPESEQAVAFMALAGQVAASVSRENARSGAPAIKLPVV